ncbi:MAG: hypothetical protein K2Y23_01270 [Cyanobacteria bacterium]|nr:hypothetical protein [Cyanobacteriota bacterium]
MALPGHVAADTRELLREQVVSAQRRSHQFYVGLTVLLMATVVTGFWPTYFGTFLIGGVARPLVMHAHGAIFTGWMLLLFLQVGLAASGNVRLHRRVGTFGIWYGAAVWIMGVIATFAAPVIHVQRGEWPLDQAAGFLILPIGDMILFGGFFGRRREVPEQAGCAQAADCRRDGLAGVRRGGAHESLAAGFFPDLDGANGGARRV